MAFEGMDPQRVLAAAKLLQLEQRNVTAIAAAVNRVANASPSYWRGADGQRFRADAQRTQAMCTAASRRIQALVEHATRNAIAQLATSNEYGGAVSGGSLKSADGHFVLGPDVKVGADGHVIGIPVSASAHAWAGAQGAGHAEAGANLKDGAYAKANGSFQAGAGADAHAAVGNNWFTVKNDATVLAGVTASGSAGAYLGLAGAGADVKGEAFAGAMAEDKTYVGNQFVNSTTDVKGVAGAGASGSAGAHADIFGASAGVHGEAFAGAKATASQEFDFGGLKASGSITGAAGVGAEGGVDASAGWHDVGGDVDVGAVLGLGGDVTVGVHLDPAEAVHDVGSLASGFVHMR